LRSPSQGLDLGADDYICKPFRRNEFLARIDGLLAWSEEGIRGTQRAQCAHKDAANATILCIDDDPVQQTIVTSILESQGFKCRSALVRRAARLFSLRYLSAR
jgi:DNA-binding response OmpR family regulator